MGRIVLPAFIVSFSLGILYAYLHIPKKQIIFIYPTLDNIDNLQYKDKTETCFNIDATKTKCNDDHVDDSDNPLFANFKIQA